MSADVDLASRDRFEFGRNWSQFLNTINERRIAAAEASLVDLLGLPTLEGRSFLDVGCGSGLFSLAARRLGARVHAFDYDAQSVACARALRSRYRPDDPQWVIESGSVLDRTYLERLGSFDVVYSWGVLHHTGSMWEALQNVAIPLKPEGTLCVAIYNDQGLQSILWRQIKRFYNILPRPFRPLMAISVGVPLEVASIGRAAATLQVRRYVRGWSAGGRVRGMNRWYDLVDWVGGYPFEVASPAQITAFYQQRGFVPTALRTCGRRMGCNEFVFRRIAVRESY
jgi:SAM-dependent methyltransferase